MWSLRHFLHSRRRRVLGRVSDPQPGQQSICLLPWLRLRSSSRWQPNREASGHHPRGTLRNTYSTRLVFPWRAGTQTFRLQHQPSPTRSLHCCRRKASRTRWRERAASPVLALAEQAHDTTHETIFAMHALNVIDARGVAQLRVAMRIMQATRQRRGDGSRPGLVARRQQMGTLRKAHRWRGERIFE